MNDEGLKQEPDLTEVVKDLLDAGHRDEVVSAITQLYNQSEAGMIPGDFDSLVRTNLEKVEKSLADNPDVDLKDEFTGFVEDLTRVAGMNSYHGITPPSHIMQEAIVDMLKNMDKGEVVS
ncbi:hypothetical protein GYA37_00695 [candidate division WWE3 bacterium]|uniref:Uncharacterized protein n=1 Tax=candidate division WWE3 bacterium TaxID=2053526 RepID=A0A7X9E6R2_UNCKA|nr:hypothetical protein [candidate division WWE3 bacterium]